VHFRCCYFPSLVDMGSDQPVSLYTALTNPFPYIPRSFIDAGVNGVGSFIGLWSVPGLAGNEPCNKGWQAAWQAGAPVRACLAGRVTYTPARACLAGRGASAGMACKAVMAGRQGYLHSSQGKPGMQGMHGRHGRHGRQGNQAGRHGWCGR
jgi:hypothetical protein